MENRLFVPKYFAGAFSGNGFKNYLTEAISGMKQIHIIKGTPGSGKSTLMKKIAHAAEENGYEVEYIYCSSDVSSLDGVVVPSLSLAVVDGTSPHVMEASYPLAVETIINTGDYIFHKELEKHTDEIIRLTDRKKELFSNAQKLLLSAQELKKLEYSITQKCYNSKKGFDFCKNVISKEEKLQKDSRPGKSFRARAEGANPFDEVAKHRLITKRSFFAFGKDGISTLNPYPTAKVFSVDSAFAPFILGTLSVLALEYGIHAVCAPHPVDVSQTAMIYLPFLNTVFVNSQLLKVGIAQKSFDTQNTVFLAKNRFETENLLKENREKLSFLRKTEKLILEEAKGYLENAMENHKKLELIYVSSLNKDALNCLAQTLILSIFNKQSEE